MTKKDIPKGGFIFVSNHTSMFDVAVVSYLLPARQLRIWAADILYTKNFFFTFFLKHIGCIFVNRHDTDMSSIVNGSKALEQDDVMVVFPEGRFSVKGEVLEFKPGAVILAERSGVPILPVYLPGEYGTKKRAEIHIGKPVYFSDLIESGGFADPSEYRTVIRNACTKLRETVLNLKGI